MLDATRAFRGMAAWDAAMAASALTVLPRKLRCEFEGGAIEMPMDELQVECGTGKTDQVVFTHLRYPGWVLSTPDKTILNSPFFEQHYGVHCQIRGIRSRIDDRRRLRATLQFLGGFTAIAFLLVNAGGWALSFVVARVPPSYEREIGKDITEKLNKNLSIAQVPDITNAIRIQLVKILGKKAAEDYNPTVQVYHSGVPNAFVVPGGDFFVSSKLIEMTETPEELAGVLAHEAAHLKLRHGVRTLLAGQGHGLLFKWMFGDRLNLLSAISAGADLLVNQTYSRELEFQADARGWDMLLAANIDPRGTVAMFKKLDEWDQETGEDDSPRWLRSHPLTQERIARLNRKWEQSPRTSGFVTLQKVHWDKTNDPPHKALFQLFK